MTADSNDIRVGDIVEYTCVCENTGDEILSVPVFVFIVFDPNNWTYIGDNAGMYNSVSGTFDYVWGHFWIAPFNTPPEHPKYYYIKPGESLTLTVKYSADVAGCYTHGVIFEFDNAHGSEYDTYHTITSTVLENDGITPSTPINPLSDIAIIKVTSDSPAKAGENVTFAIKVTNTGDSTFDQVSITDVIPDELEYVSDDSDGVEVTDDDGVGVGIVNFSLTELGAGEMVNIQMVTKVKDDTGVGTYVNVVSASGEGEGAISITSTQNVGSVVLDTEEHEITSIQSIEGMTGDSHELEITSIHEVTTP